MSSLPHRIEFEIDGEPIPKARARATIRGGKPAVYTPTETTRYEKLVREKAEAARVEYAKAGRLWPMAAATYFVFANIYNRRRSPDGDNVFKSVADGMQGALYQNDAKVGGVFPPPQIHWRPHVHVVVVAFEVSPVVLDAHAIARREHTVQLCDRVVRASSPHARELAIAVLREHLESNALFIPEAKAHA